MSTNQKQTALFFWGASSPLTSSEAETISVDRVIEMKIDATCLLEIFIFRIEISFSSFLCSWCLYYTACNIASIFPSKPFTCNRILTKKKYNSRLLRFITVFKAKTGEPVFYYGLLQFPRTPDHNPNTNIYIKSMYIIIRLMLDSD